MARNSYQGNNYKMSELKAKDLMSIHLGGDAVVEHLLSFTQQLVVMDKFEEWKDYQLAIYPYGLEGKRPMNDF